MVQNFHGNRTDKRNVHQIFNCQQPCPGRIVDIVRELGEYNIEVDVYDPWVDPADAVHEYGIEPVAAPRQGAYDGIVLAVAHQQFKDMSVAAIRALGKTEHVLYDLKYVLTADEADLRL